MWHEARKNERTVRKAIVNYRKRAERKHDYYDKIKQDPIKFMQVHGRRCKLHIDENEMGSEPANSMVAWQGDKTNMIDRFDVRAHLDFIRDINPALNPDTSMNKEERKLNFERYRNLVYNKYKGTSEQSHLQQIRINESFPEAGTQRQDAEAKKKLLAPSKASISFNYDDGQRGGGVSKEEKEEESEEDEHDILSDEEFWRELEEIPPLKDCSAFSLKEMETASLEFGMCYGDFTKSLTNDQNIQNKLDRDKEIESEKQQMAGKKSRRERRILKDNRLKNRVIGPLTYIYKNEEEIESSSSESDSNSSHKSRSSTPDEKDKIEFITSFGESNTSSVPTAFDEVPTKVKSKKIKRKSKSRSPARLSSRHEHRKVSRSRSRSRDYKYHSSRRLSRSRSREGNRYPWKLRSQSRSRSRERAKYRRSRTRSRSAERRYPWKRSRSRSRSPRRKYSSSSRNSDRYRRRSSSREKSPIRSRPVATLKSTPVSKSVTDVKKLTPQEKLKIKMQRALKKQLKADKIATADKRAQAYQEQVERDEDLREMARRNRKRDSYRDSPPRRSLYGGHR